MRCLSVLLFALLALPRVMPAQQDSLLQELPHDSTELDTLFRRKIIAWATPSKADEIDGISFCYFISPSNNTHGWNQNLEHTTINGLNVQVFPFAFMLTPYMIAMPALGISHLGDADAYKKYAREFPEAIINGINISQNQVGGIRIRGINLNAACSHIDEVHGISINGFTHYSHIMHGVSIATLRNWCAEMRGVQIGIYNRADDLRGFQFGLWNVNARRKLPLVNWQFKKL